ncbi:MAG: DUF4153 domain-containing protein [Bacteroidota bacterium]
MKLQSINQLIKNSLQAFIRFPFAILISALGVFFAFKLINIDSFGKGNNDYLFEALMTCALGLPLFISISLIMERRMAGAAVKIVVQAIFSGVLYLYFITYKGHYLTDDLVRFWVLNAGLHFLVSFSPFIGKKEINGFWQFNKTLFLRSFLSGIYTSVLFLGLALALLAIDKLLGFHIPEKNYLRLWLVLVGLFNTWFFLSGVPEDFDELNESENYPKGLKIFTQFVLLPLVSIYLIILYIYIGKIIVKNTLPHGWTSMLVICFGTVGILSLLLIHPIKEQEENRWMKIYSKWFYLALLPLICLMFISIIKRIHDYGVTEDRYYVLLLACWLTLIAAYFNISKIKNIKLIPISLTVIAFASCYGPWSAKQIAVHSQYGRLVTELNKIHLMKDGKIIKTNKPVKDIDEENIISVSEYLVNTHGLNVIQPLFKENLDSLIGKNSRGSYSRYMDSWKVKEILQKRYLSEVEQEISFEPETADSSPVDVKKRLYFYASNYSANNILLVKGYDFIFDYNDYNSNRNSTKNKISLQIDSTSNITIYASVNQKKMTLDFTDSIENKCSFDLKTFIEMNRNKDTQSENSYSLSVDEMTLRNECTTFNMKVIIKSMNIAISDSSSKIENLTITALIHFK